MLVVEKDVEIYLKKRVEKLGGKCIKFPASFEEGIPDRIVVMPGGRVIFIELKRPVGGRLSEVQKYQIQKLKQLGCEVYILRSKQEIDLLLREYYDDGADNT